MDQNPICVDAGVLSTDRTESWMKRVPRARVSRTGSGAVWQWVVPEIGELDLLDGSLLRSCSALFLPGRPAARLPRLRHPHSDHPHWVQLKQPDEGTRAPA